MRVVNTMLAVSGALLMSVAANAVDVTLLDSIASGSAWNLGSSNANGRIIGSDPGGASLPDKTQAGYAVIPFTITANNKFQLTSITTVLNIQAPATGGNASNDFYGAIIASPSGTSLNALSANLVHFTGGTGQGNSFFKFDTSPATMVDPDPTHNGVLIGKNQATQVTATLNTGPTLAAGSYFLVLAPKAGFNASVGDNLLDVGVLLNRTQTQIGVGNLSTTFASEQQGAFEGGPTGGARPGDVLTPAKTATNAAQFFGVKVTAAIVPEASTYASMMMGLVPMGLLVARRRRAQQAK